MQWSSGKNALFNEGSADILELPAADRPLYTLRDVAIFLGIPEATLRTWVRGRSYPIQNGTAWSEPLLNTTGDSLLSFNNLVEANVLAALRKVHQVPMNRVREAIDYARRLGHPRPLLLDLKAGLGEVFLDHYGELVALSRKGQMALKAIVESYLNRVERDKQGRPLRFHPAIGVQSASERVVLDPLIGYGAPTVKGIKTHVIAMRFEVGETEQELAEDYGLELADVREAILFEGLASAA